MIASDGRKLGYGELVAGDLLHVQAQPTSKLKDPATFKIMGQPVPRVDIPAKVTGGAAYVQDMRLPGMVHARIVRPPSYGAQLMECDISATGKMPGVVKVVRDGNFLAVVANKEFEAVKAMGALSAAARWKETASLPKQDDLPRVLMNLRSDDKTIFQQGTPPVATAKTLEASYTRPYHSHGSIGPSCAVAQSVDGTMTVWTHTQGVYPDRQGIAEMLRVPPDNVHLIHVEGSGCYGHNGADDAAADAALIAREMPGVPVRVQWMREQEHSWEPYGPAMVTKLKASLDESWRDRGLEFRGLEQHSFDAARRRRSDAGGATHRATVPGAAAEADAAAGRRRRPQRDPDLQISERPCRASFRAGDAAADFGDARARRLSQCVLDRELYG